MAAALLAAVATLAATSAQAQAAAGVDVVGLIRKACVDTAMNRDAFRSLARAEGWRPISTVMGPGSRYWVESYLVDDDRVTLTDVDDGSPSQPACAVMVTNPSRDWRDTVPAMAAELNLGSPNSGSQRTDESAGWSVVGGPSLTYGYTASSDLLIITFARPLYPAEDGVIVVESIEAVSPQR